MINKERIDFLTLVTEGEPTLDIHLGDLISELKKTDLKVAVISNSSLIHSEDVKKELSLADWVSLKIDSVHQETWKKINRPHGKLKLDSILEHIIEFQKNYRGFLAVETMFVEGMNTSDEEVEKLSAFIAKVSPHTAYLSAPIRPPADSSVQSPDMSFFYRTMDIYRKKNVTAELNCSLEDIHFGYSTGDIEKEILSIVSVHPLREDALREIITSGSFHWDIIEKMCDKGILKKTDYQNCIYYQKG